MMPPLPVLLLSLLSATTALGVQAETYLVQTSADGNISCLDTTGKTIPLTGKDDNSSQATLSPDGHTVAFIKVDSQPSDEFSHSLNSVWLGNCTTGASRRLLAPHASGNPKQTLTELNTPTFSLNGNFVYVITPAWTTADAIHQINIKTGKVRFIIEGDSFELIRHGGYAGYLVVKRHLEMGTDNSPAYFVVNPNGEDIIEIPDSEDNYPAVGQWLKQHHSAMGGTEPAPN